MAEDGGHVRSRNGRTVTYRDWRSRGAGEDHPRERVFEISNCAAYCSRVVSHTVVPTCRIPRSRSCAFGIEDEASECTRPDISNRKRVRIVSASAGVAVGVAAQRDRHFSASARARGAADGIWIEVMRKCGTLQEPSHLTGSDAAWSALSFQDESSDRRSVWGRGAGSGEVAADCIWIIAGVSAEKRLVSCVCRGDRGL